MDYEEEVDRWNELRRREAGAIELVSPGMAICVKTLTKAWCDQIFKG